MPHKNPDFRFTRIRNSGLKSLNDSPGCNFGAEGTKFIQTDGDFLKSIRFSKLDQFSHICQTNFKLIGGTVHMAAQ